MKKKSSGKIVGSIKVTIINILVFSLGFFPIIIFGKILLFFVPFTELWQLLLIPFIITIGIFIILFYQLIFTGLIVHVFNIKYKPGTYEYSFKDKTAFRWIVLCSLYTPLRKILEIIPMGGLRNTYYRLLGMKIGENTLVGGVIKDPCLTEFGDNVTMGEYAIIYGHIHNYEKGTIIMDKVKVGNNVVIGAGAIIMPGAVIEDDVSIAAGAVVAKGQVLKKDKIYGGVPAKEIKAKKK
ncbi:MAG: hypothetical protein DRM98_05655 [Thermoplasmata archaeon]|nr:MAG: hypothetical protein DRM98_05655 [Thermoplasmata archaeon]